MSPLVEDSEWQWSTERISSPTEQLMSTEQGRGHERVSQTEDADVINRYIKAATRRAETFTHRAFVEQDRRLTLADFPGGDVLRLPSPPLISVTSVKHTDINGNTETFSSSKYNVDARSLPGRIVLADGESWPDPDLRTANAVEVEYKAGYGSSRDEVPDDIRQAVRMLFGHFYEHREPVVVGTSAVEIPEGPKNLMRPHRYSHV